MSLQVSVVPEKCVRISRGKTCVAALWFGPFVQRPFVWPFLGADDRELTRLGHPNDPVGHSHHRSVWIAHADVGGVDFWAERRGTGSIVLESVDEVKSDAPTVSFLARCTWRKPDGAILLREDRRLSFTDRARGLVLDIDTSLRAEKDQVSLGKTNFGLLGVRLARTLRPAERLGGLFISSNEAENEAGCFGQHADWIDASGPVPRFLAPGEKHTPQPSSLPAQVVGLACFDHPENSPRDTLWHVRDDGWFGPGISRDGPREISAEAPLRARYRLQSHVGRPWQSNISEDYRNWRGAVLREGD